MFELQRHEKRRKGVATGTKKTIDDDPWIRAILFVSINKINVL